MGIEFKFFKKKKEKQQAEKEVLNLLKRYLKESQGRIGWISEKIKELKEESLFDIRTADEILRREDAWFDEESNHLLSAYYYTAVLFAMMKRVRESSPFLKLTVKDDTKMLDLLNNIVKDYMKYFKIHYMMQNSIGDLVYDEQEKKIMSYQEFCGMVRDEKELKKCEPLLECYLHVNMENVKKVDMLLKDMESLGSFLEIVVPEEAGAQL